MILFTMVGKVSKGLILATDAIKMQDDADTLSPYRDRAKGFMKKIQDGSLVHDKASVECDKYFFHYIVSEDIMFLCLCERSDSKVTAFKYLQSIEEEFRKKYTAQDIANVRAYGFFVFEKTIDSLKEQSKSSKNSVEKLDQLRQEVQNVASIVTLNIRDVVSRGEHMDELGAASSQLADSAQQFKKITANLNFEMMIRKHAPICIIFAVVIFLLFLRFKVFKR